jgi:hypothetical protein
MFCINPFALHSALCWMGDMRRRATTFTMRALTALASVYVVLAQLATLDVGLHAWMHGLKAEAFEGCPCAHHSCHSTTDSNPDGEPPTGEREASDGHHCLVSLLAGGVKAADYVFFNFTVAEALRQLPVLALEFCHVADWQWPRGRSPPKVRWD